MKTHHLLIRWVGAVCLLALAVGSAGCEIPTGELPTCVWGDPMPAYEMVSPADWSTIDDLTPTLTWRLRGEASCLPAEYKVQIQSAMLYPLGASAGYLVFSGRSTTQSLVWPDDADPLLPGHTYYVYIINMVDHDGELAPAGETGFGYFNTGPLCGAADRLSAPSLRWPPNGWTVDPSTTITLEWIVPWLVGQRMIGPYRSRSLSPLRIRSNSKAIRWKASGFIASSQLIWGSRIARESIGGQDRTWQALGMRISPRSGLSLPRPQMSFARSTSAQGSHPCLW